MAAGLERNLVLQAAPEVATAAGLTAAYAAVEAPAAAIQLCQQRQQQQLSQHQQQQLKPCFLYIF